MAIFADAPEKFMSEFATEFERGFLEVLSSRYGTKYVHANVVYNEYIQDRHHIHMNATPWANLTDFVQYLGHQQKAHIDERADGWYVAWIDHDPRLEMAKIEAEKAAAAQRAHEERQLALMQAAAQAAAAAAAQAEPVPEPTAQLADAKPISLAKAPMSLSKTAKPKPASSGGGALGLLRPAAHAPAPPLKSAAPDDAILKMFRAENEAKAAAKQAVAARAAARVDALPEDSWLRAKLVVKIKNKRLADGKYYGRKGTIKLVEESGAAQVKLKDSKAVLRLPQKDLQPTLPPAGGYVMVLMGQYTGAVGKAIAYEDRAQEVVVRVPGGGEGSQSHQMTLPMEAVCRVDRHA